MTSESGIKWRGESRRIQFEKERKNYASISEYAQEMRRYGEACRQWEYACRQIQQQQWMQYIATPQTGQPQLNAAQQFSNNEPIVNFEPAPLIRRISAEVVDFMICLLFKLLVALFLIEMQWIDVNSFQKIMDDDSDMVEFMIVTQALLPIEMGSKVVCAFLEAFIMVVNIGPCKKGQTPGKWIVGIRVIATSKITESNIPNFVQVHGPKEITLKQSLIRSLFKNIIVNSLFPFTTVAFNLSSTQSLYDSLLKTIVVMS